MTISLHAKRVGREIASLNEMPRIPFTCSSEHPYHLTARSNNRDWFAIPLAEVWVVMSDYLFFLHHAFNVKIHSYVLMENHFHLVASFPNANLSESMNYFMRETSRVIGFESDRINHVYGNRVYRSKITSFHHFQNVYKYVYRNPVQAGACSKVEDYPFSTLHDLLGRGRGIIPIEDDPLLFESDFASTLSWLNRHVEPEDLDAIRKALRNPNFKLAADAHSRKAHRLESQML